LDSVWLIGHSLGAHIAGFVGKRRPGIGRITGLDPAEPFFQGYPVDARLDPSDANFVDVIHSDIASIFAGGFGSKDLMGHVDFFPNGGYNQPGCRNMTIKDVDGVESGKIYVACNHQRAYKLFIESMKAKVEGRSCHFKAHRCSSYESYMREECQDCGKGGCTFMGPDALATRPKTNEKHVKMYLITLDKAPYCAEQFFDTSVEISSGSSKDRGQIFVKLNAKDEDIQQEITATTKDNLLPGQSLHRLNVRRERLGIEEIPEMQIRFKHYWSYIDPSSWPVWGKSKIRVNSASIAELDSDEQLQDTSNRISFCLKGQKDFVLEDTKDSKDKWTTLQRC